MNAKKMKLEKRELKEVNDLTTEFKDKAFPTRLIGMNKILEVIIDNEIICYLCMDMTPGSAILHLYLPKIHRNTKTIKAMVQIFYSHVHPWCKKQNCVQIIVNCPAEDLKTTEMFKTFGFKPETINLAIMPIK